MGAVCGGSSTCGACVALPGMMWLTSSGDGGNYCDSVIPPGPEHCVEIDPNLDPVCWNDPGPPADIGTCMPNGETWRGLEDTPAVAPDAAVALTSPAKSALVALPGVAVALWVAVCGGR